MLVENPNSFVKPKQVLIMKNHTQYEYHSYKDIKELPTQWLLTNLYGKGQDLGSQFFPISMFDGLPVKGFTTYRCFKFNRGILQYYNNEVGFRFNTGSYYFARFYNTEDAYEYFKFVLAQKEINLDKYFLLLNDKYKYHTGDIFTVNKELDFIWSRNDYEDLLGLPNNTIWFDYFSKTDIKNNATIIGEDQLKEIDEIPKDEVIKEAALKLCPGDKLQVYTNFEIDGEIIGIIPAAIPDLNYLRMRNVPDSPYMGCLPLNYIISYEDVELINGV